jgi:hypothetical protein
MWAPTVDGVELTMPPQQALALGPPYVNTGVNFLLGSNRDEGSTFVLAQHGFGDDVSFGNTSGLPGFPPDAPGPYNKPYSFLKTTLNETEFDIWAQNLWGNHSAAMVKMLYPPTNNTPDRHPDPALTQTTPTAMRSLGLGAAPSDPTMAECNVSNSAEMFVFDANFGIKASGSEIKSEYTPGEKVGPKCFTLETLHNKAGVVYAAVFLDCKPGSPNSQRWIFRALNASSVRRLASHASKSMPELAAGELVGQLVPAEEGFLCLLFENRTVVSKGKKHHTEKLRLAPAVGKVVNCTPIATHDYSNVWRFTPRTQHTNNAHPTPALPTSAPQSTTGSLKALVYSQKRDGSTESGACLSAQPPPLIPHSTWWWAASRATGDFILTCPTRRAARLLTNQTRAVGRAVGRAVDRYSDYSPRASNQTAPEVFMYYFNHTPMYSANQKQTALYGAFHGSEVPFVWGSLFELGGTGEQALSESMVNYWTNFAWSGNPNYRTDEQGQRAFVQPLEWPVYAAATDGNILLDVTVGGHKTQAMDHLKTKICDFWDTVNVNASQSNGI